MLIKTTGTDTIEIKNPILADYPPMKGAETMLRRSDKITVLYCCLSRDGELTNYVNSIVNLSILGRTKHTLHIFYKIQRWTLVQI